MNWADLDLWAFDTETTSLDILGEARIATAALVRLRPGGEALERTWTINSGMPMDPGATKVNGITDAHLAEHGTDPATTIAEIGTAVRWILDQHLPLVIQNAAFDLTLLEVELGRHGHEPIGASRMGTVIDPLVLSQQIDRIKNLRKGKPPRINDKLPTLCSRYKVPFTETHDACADAIGAGRLALAIAKKHDHLMTYSPYRLHKLQQVSHAAEARGFAEWVEKKGLTEKFGDIDTGWPLHTALQAVSA